MYGLSNCLQSGKMDHAVYGSFLHNGEHFVTIPHIRLIGRNRFSRNFLNAANSLRTAVAVVIDDDDIMPRLLQCNSSMRTDIPGSASQ